MQFDSCSAPLPSASYSPLPELSIRVDPTNHARAFCNGMSALVSLGGLFEFYRTDFAFRRSRIAIGPWEGVLKSRLTARPPDIYSLSGGDPVTGAKSFLEFRKDEQNTLEMTFSFTAPRETTKVSFEIAKIAGYLGSGASLASSPASRTDSVSIPVKPRPTGNHILLKAKNRVVVGTPLCDIEILDLQSSKSILVADSRNVPWDRKKSIVVSAESVPVVPGDTYTFKFRVRMLTPTSVAKGGAGVASGEPANPAPNGEQIHIIPKEETIATGSYVLNPHNAIFGSPTGIAEQQLQAAIQQLTGHRLPINSLHSGRGIVIETASSQMKLPPEGYEISISPVKVVIRGADARGCLYGAYELATRIANDGGQWKIPCGTIRDWPDMPVRGMCLELLPPAIHDVTLMKRYLSALSRSRCNLVIFLHNPRQMLAWSRNKDDGGWRKNEMQEIAAYARSLHMDVWGGMGSGFDAGSFPGMNIITGANFYDPLRDDSYRQLFSLYSEILQTYNPSALLISHDEMSGLNLYAGKYGITTADIFAADVNRIHAWLAENGVRTAMWGDMLLDYRLWDAGLGNANSMNPPFNSGATHLAVDKIAKDVMILDWHYGYRSEYRSIEYFRGHGFTVFGAPWYDPQGAVSLARSVRKFKGAGVVGTDWGFWKTLSPSATTVYTLLGGWSTRTDVDEGDADITALANMLRDKSNSWHLTKQTTINLSPYANRSTLDTAQGKAKGVFGSGLELDFRGLSAGRQVLGGVLFDLKTADDGKSANVVVVEAGSALLARKKISLGRQLVQSVAFLHTALVEEPQVTIRSLGEYEIEYESGRKVLIDLLENYSITDVRSGEGLRNNAWSFTRMPEVLIGSREAWRGRSATGIPLNLQCLIWKNPYPSEALKSIIFRANKEPQGTKLALLGITLLQ